MGFKLCESFVTDFNKSNKNENFSFITFKNKQLLCNKCRFYMNMKQRPQSFQQKISHENFLHEIFIDGRVVAKAYAMHLYVIIIR